MTVYYGLMKDENLQSIGDKFDCFTVVDGWMNLKSCKWDPPPLPPNIAIESVTLDQEFAVPGRPILVTAKVTGVRINPDAEGVVPVTLRVGPRTFMSYATYSDLAIHPVDVKFSITFTQAEIGTQSISVSINVGWKESDYTDNIYTLDITVGAQRALTLILSKNEVLPKLREREAESQTVITAKLNGPASEIAGKYIRFTSVAKDLTGGHNHSGGRPTGTPANWACITDAQGFCSAPITYTASEFGGKETILASLVEDPSIKTFRDLDIKFPDGHLIAIEEENTFRLTGSNAHNNAHHLNHHLTLSAAGNAIILAGDFYDLYNATLGFNDMSLPRGGLFDIKTLWNPPHGLHREGKSLDIDQCAKALTNDGTQKGPVLDWKGNPVLNEDKSIRYCPTGWIPVPKPKLRNLCNAHDGTIKIEPTIHCEFD